MKSRTIRTKSQETASGVYGDLINDKGGILNQWGKNRVCVWGNWLLNGKINKVRSSPDISGTNISKWIEYLNVKNKMIEVLDQDIGKCFL